MGQPAAKQGDQVTAIDTHIVMVPSGPSMVPTPLPHPFTGVINGGLSTDVNILGMPAATVGSTADNTPPHLPTPPGVIVPGPAVQQGDHQERERDGQHQRQESGAQWRRRDDLQRSFRSAGRHGGCRRHGVHWLERGADMAKAVFLGVGWSFPVELDGGGAVTTGPIRGERATRRSGSSSAPPRASV